MSKVTFLLLAVLAVTILVTSSALATTTAPVVQTEPVAAMTASAPTTSAPSAQAITWTAPELDVGITQVAADFTKTTSTPSLAMTSSTATPATAQIATWTSQTAAPRSTKAAAWTMAGLQSDYSYTGTDDATYKMAAHIQMVAQGPVRQTTSVMLA